MTPRPTNRERLLAVLRRRCMFTGTHDHARLMLSQIVRDRIRVRRTPPMHDSPARLDDFLVGIACGLILLAGIYGWAVFP